MKRALGGLVIVLTSSVARAVPDPQAESIWRPSFTFLPGASQEISHALSASRDTAVLGTEITPYPIVIAGLDVALFGLAWPKLGFRVRGGFVGFQEFESERPYKFSESSLLTFPPQAVDLWRGQRGLQLAIALDGARRWFGPRGLIEVTLGFRHESEHHTGSDRSDEQRQTEESRVLNVGDFLLYDLAARIPVQRFDVELRAQEKLFAEASGDFDSTYSYGLSFDAILRWRLTESVHPFSSFFAEHLWGNNFRRDGFDVRVPDSYLLRNLTGVILPGRVGDLYLFLSASVGHGKGERVYEEDAQFGGGLRFVFF